MDTLKIVWIEDKKEFVTGLLKRKIKFVLEDREIFVKENGVEYDLYLIKNDVWLYDGPKISLTIEHTNYVYEPDLETLAKWSAENKNTLFLIDYNLKDHNGNGINGDEIIKCIRKHNSGKIIFYSSEASQQDLRDKITGLNNVECVAREHLFDRFVDEFEELLSSD